MRAGRLQQETHDAIQALSGQNMYFRFGKMEIPFTTDNFLATFSKPNLYFHATTTYTILRQLGTPLGKLDFLGNMKSDTETNRIGVRNPQVGRPFNQAENV